MKSKDIEEVRTLTFAKYNFCDPKKIANLTVIHYGDKEYVPGKFIEIKNDDWIKPRFGLWTSPVDSEYGWKNWCSDNEFRECHESNSFKLKFKPHAKIVLVDSVDDLLLLPVRASNIYTGRNTIDFNFLAQTCDAMWLTDKGERQTRYSDPISLYGWDCETVLIFNKDCCYAV